MKLSLCQLLFFILVSVHYVRGHGIRIPLSKQGGDFFYNLSPFYGSISIGTPPQNFNVSFNTQSSYFNGLWISASFMNSSSFRVPGHSYYNYNASYTHRCQEECKVISEQGPVSGEGFWAIDTITMDNVQITNQRFYAITNITGLENEPHDGCVALTYEPVILPDNIISQFCKQLEEDSKFSLHFTNDPQGTQGGELTLCEVNETNFQGEQLNYVNTATIGNWNFLIEKISLGHGNQRNQEVTVKAIARIDTNTSFIKGPLRDIEQIFRGINSTISKKIQNHQEVDCDAIHELPNILFRIRGQDYTFTGYDYILELLNDNKRVCIVGLINSDYAQTWFFGELFLRKFYTVFHMEKRRIGIAESKYYTSRPRVYKTTIMISLF